MCAARQPGCIWERTVAARQIQSSWPKHSRLIYNRAIRDRTAYVPERREAIHKMPALSWSVIGEKRVLVYKSFESDEMLFDMFGVHLRGVRTRQTRRGRVGFV